jgi:hypothetical protein
MKSALVLPELEPVSCDIWCHSITTSNDLHLGDRDSILRYRIETSARIRITSKCLSFINHKVVCNTQYDVACGEPIEKGSTETHVAITFPA